MPFAIPYIIAGVVALFGGVTVINSVSSASSVSEPITFPTVIPNLDIPVKEETITNEITIETNTETNTETGVVEDITVITSGGTNIRVTHPTNTLPSQEKCELTLDYVETTETTTAVSSTSIPVHTTGYVIGMILLLLLLFVFTKKLFKSKRSKNK